MRTPPFRRLAPDTVRTLVAQLDPHEETEITLAARGEALRRGEDEIVSAIQFCIDTEAPGSELDHESWSYATQIAYAYLYYWILRTAGFRADSGSLA